MNIHPLAPRCAIAVAALLLASYAGAQVSPDEALARMRPAEGFEVTLFASEPDLWNPTSMDVDARGRVWIAEAVNYRLFNQEETTPLGDRIRVLEDTDGDGTCDKATTFYQHPTLQAPMGIAVLGNRVYVCQSPDLFYLEDTDGDGKADKRVVILTGFGGVDNDHAIHGVVWGPDGHLYMSNGDKGLDVTDKHGNRVHAGQGAPLMAATVLRTDLEGDRLEWLADSMRNPYEPTVDSFGNVFISDNDDDGNENTHINYVMEGGNYGYWPRRKGDRRLESVHWNMDRPGVVPRMIRTGFGSPCGIMVYDGDALPGRVSQALIHAEAGPGEIRAYYPQPDGAGFAAEQEVLLRCEGDSWFRPVDVCAAPDGSLFIADWYDPGVGGHRMGDVARGRVYRLTKTGSGSTYKPGTENLDTDSGLKEAFASPNIARRFIAWNALERKLEAGDTKVLRQLATDDNPVVRARALWLIARDPDAGPAALDAASTSESVAERVQAVRVIGQQDTAALLAYPPLLDDPSPMVRRQALLELARATPDPRVDGAMLALASRYDGNDRFYREAIGIAFRGREPWAWEQLSTRLGADWNEQLAGLAIQLHPPAVVPVANSAAYDSLNSTDLRMAALQALDATGLPEAGAEIARHVHYSEALRVVPYALELLARDGGDAWREVLDSSEVDEFVRGQLDDSDSREMAFRFISEARRPAFVPDLLNHALDPSQPTNARVRSIQVAASMADRASTPVEVLERLIDDEQGRIVNEALTILSRFRDDPSREQLHAFVLDGQKPRGLRRTAARLLVESKPGAMALLKSAEDGALTADIEFDAGEALRSCRFDDVRMLAGQVLPPEMTRDGRPLPTIAELMQLTGDGLRGRDVFFSEERSQCYQCHVVGSEGRRVGPDLTAIGSKYGREGLFESILNPSAAISHEYVVWVVETLKGDLMTGFLRKDEPDAIELVDSTGVSIAIPAADIADRYKSDMSLMPNGLAAGMTAQELANVVAFLESQK